MRLHAASEKEDEEIFSIPEKSGALPSTARVGNDFAVQIIET